MSPDLTLWATDDYLKAHAAGSFRPARLRDPMLRGADIYSLQVGLAAFYPQITQDGVYGPQTTDYVAQYQRRFDLVKDGVAGGATQVDLSGRLAKQQGYSWALPEGVPFGHVWQESSGIIGRYSPKYLTGDAAGSRDQGVVMMNDRYYSTGTAFNAVKAIDTLCQKIKTKHEQYRNLGVDDPRAWQLACGAWNAPAWADRLAKGEPLSAANLAWFNSYVESVTAYAETLN